MGSTATAKVMAANSPARESRERTAGETVSMDDLMLSAKIAKIALPDELLCRSPYANRYTASRDASGGPKDIRWRSFYESIEYPKLSSEADRMSRRKLRPQSAGPVAVKAEEVVEAAPVVQGPSDAEIRRAQRVLQQVDSGAGPL